MYGFRLRFFVAPGAGLTFADPELTVPLVGGVNVAAKAGEHRRMQEVNLQAAGMSEVEARQYGERLRRAVRLAGVKVRLGVDTGRDRRLGTPGKVLVEMAAQDGVSLLPAVHGVAVFEATRPVKFFSASGDATVLRPAPPFMDEVSQFYASHPAVTDKQEVALDVYHSSRFEESPRARFLSLITVVECLAERPKRSSEERELLDRFAQQIKDAALPEEEHTRLMNGLLDLKRESIGKACADIVTQRCGAEAATFFKKCYGARSELVHAGTTNIKVEDAVEPLDVLVSHLLLRDIEGRDAGGSPSRLGRIRHKV
jgi:hypothetical protein